MNAHHTVVIICGPTAVGKTALAVKLAQQLQTEIISADSRQCFKELNIGVAKPSTEDLQSVHHYFINSHSIHEEVNAVVFEQHALKAVEQIFTKTNVAVMVGGTGLYIKAFCEGLDEMPSINEHVRQHVTEKYKTHGITYLQKELAEKDPVFWQRAEQHNPQRLMRALEVLLSTGQSITAFQRAGKRDRNFNICKIGLQLPREQLYKQVDSRVDMMVEYGLVKEVKTLQPYQNLNALQTVGYKEMFEHLEGKCTLAEAIGKVKLNTRHYAKRQMTWFTKDKDIRWLDAGSDDNLQQVINLL